MKTIQLHHNGLTTASFLSLQQTCKTWIKQALVSILTAALMLSTTVAVSATSGTLLNWSLNDGSGTIASDSSGLGNNGTVSGGATWVTGKVGGALSFDGASGAVTLASVSGIATGNTPHTVAAWVKVNALPSNRAWILLLGNEGTGAHHWLINSAGGTALGVWSGSQVSPSLPVGQWKHIALTFDGTTLTGYVNGVSIGSQAATFNLAGTPLTLAQAHVGENYFNGVVDELNVYNRALSAAEVATLAGASTNIPPTVSLTAPTNGATYTAPATITLSATAADSDGTIAKVEFYNGTTLLGVASANPPALTLSGVAAGSYTYTAKAYDNLGASTVSAPISISVTNATSSSNIYYIYADHLNTPRVITDTANNVVWKWSSDPFGTDLPQGVTISGAKFNYNLRFPGQYYDQETGLHYNANRDYDPGTGRYVQSDPIGLAGGINTYSYTAGNPISFTDPLGLFTSSTHNEITTAAIAMAGSPCPNLPAAVAMADWLPGSQDPKNAHWHAMRNGKDPTATPATAKRDFDNFVNEQSKACTCEGLARALHAIQDSFARGHAGGQPWSGGLPSLSHAYHDGYPSQEERSGAVNASAAAIRNFGKECKNQCPK
jgi:RHS repeat-associated protein